MQGLCHGREDRWEVVAAEQSVDMWNSDRAALSIPPVMWVEVLRRRIGTETRASSKLWRCDDMKKMMVKVQKEEEE